MWIWQDHEIGHRQNIFHQFTMLIYVLKKQSQCFPSKISVSALTVRVWTAEVILKYDLFTAVRDPKHSPGGELVLGGTDPNYYTGNFNYMDTREVGKWEVTMKG